MEESEKGTAVAYKLFFANIGVFLVIGAAILGYVDSSKEHSRERALVITEKQHETMLQLSALTKDISALYKWDIEQDNRKTRAVEKIERNVEKLKDAIDKHLIRDHK